MIDLQSKPTFRILEISNCPIAENKLNNNENYAVLESIVNSDGAIIYFLLERIKDNEENNMYPTLQLSENSGELIFDNPILENLIHAIGQPNCTFYFENDKILFEIDLNERNE